MKCRGQYNTTAEQKKIGDDFLVYVYSSKVIRSASLFHNVEIIIHSRSITLVGRFDYSELSVIVTASCLP